MKKLVLTDLDIQLSKLELYELHEEVKRRMRLGYCDQDYTIADLARAILAREIKFGHLY